MPYQAPNPDPSSAHSLMPKLETRYLPAMEDVGNCIGAEQSECGIQYLASLGPSRANCQVRLSTFLSRSKNLALHEASDEGLSKCCRQWWFAGVPALVRQTTQWFDWFASCGFRSYMMVLQGIHARHHSPVITMPQLVSINAKRRNILTILPRPKLGADESTLI